MKRLLLLATSLTLASGCASVTYTKTAPDGTQTAFSAHSLFSNSALKGLSVDSSTKTTTNALRLASTGTEPNSESITATGTALGELIGAAAATAAKSAVKP